MGTKIFRYIICGIASISTVCSCNYLDVDPELGVGEDEVFSTYRNIKRYLEFYFDAGETSHNIYAGFPRFMNMAGNFNWDATTDAADNGYLGWGTKRLKKGVLQESDIKSFCDGDGCPVATAMWRTIRVANMTLEKIGGIADGTEQEKCDLIGQAYFIRGYAHFCLCRFYGGVPYIDHVLHADDDWDLARLSAYDTYIHAAEDMEKAYKYMEKAGKVRRDGYPGEPGFLNASDLLYPCGVAAKAMRSRILLYAASPLTNEKGREDWENAAQAAAEALELALKEHYYLVEFDEYTDNFYGFAGTAETIWIGYNIKNKDNIADFQNYLTYPQSNYATANGICPTQNFVDKYETAWGDPLNTESDRNVAEMKNHFNPQDPYSNLDPRFYTTIVFDGCTTVSGTGGTPVNIYYDPDTKTYPKTSLSNVSVDFGIQWGSVDNDKKGYSNTGYYYQKTWSGSRGDKSNSYIHCDPVIRLAELYLNYAEAVNESYGPNGKAEGCSLTAIQALNTVRARCGMPEVQSYYTTSAELLRDRIRNERSVELAFEGNHYYFDIRRWMTAREAMSQTLYGMYIEKVPVSNYYPKGRKYVRTPIPDSRQCTWKDCMYWFPFSRDLTQTMKNFDNNPSWN